MSEKLIFQQNIYQKHFFFFSFTKDRPGVNFMKKCLEHIFALSYENLYTFL